MERNARPIPTTRPPQARPRGPAIPGAPLPSLHHPSLEERTYEHLRALMLDRRLAPGSRVPVDQFAAEMGVSRTPVLNALRRLAQEGVVEVAPRRGIFVRRFSRRHMVRIFLLREVLEGLAARLSASRISRSEIARLEALFRGFGGTPSAEAVRRYVESDRTFHGRLVEIAGIPELARTVESVHMMFYVSQAGLVRPPQETLQEHLAIIAALRRGDPEASEAAMRLHIRRSLQQLEREAETEEADPAPPSPGPRRRTDPTPGRTP